MGSFANTLFIILLGWLQGAVSAVWSALTSENGASFLTWVGQHWIVIAAVLCIAGLAADLCVYILRWKPFRVWKSFFLFRQTHDEPYSGEKRAKSSGTSVRTGRPEKRKIQAEDSAGAQEDDPDFSKWEQGPSVKGQTETATAGSASVVTKAGYAIPPDSPYRRPPEAAKGTQQSGPEPAYETEPSREIYTPSKPKRRRRISVSELFTDPEEEIREYDAPQHLIDRRAAYHEPVYPRAWKKSEKEEEEE